MSEAKSGTMSQSRANSGTIEGLGKFRESRQARRALIAILILFTLTALPSLLWPLQPHPDERRYSIAAAHMIDGASWLVPISETGDIRLKKPPLTYWYLLPGFALMGETLMAAKILFLASALGVIAMAFALARALGASPLASVVAASVVAGHGIFFTTSTQHIPDMPLLLGLSVSLWGAIRVLGPDSVQSRDWAALWLGLAWAVLAKGLLPLLLAILILVLLGVPDPARAEKTKRARSAALGWGLAALTLSGAWFVWIGVTYPDELIREFIGDQVTDKAGFDFAQVLAGLRKTATDLTIPTLPALMALLFARRWPFGTNTPETRPHRAVTLLALWCVCTVVLFAFSTQLYERYILPALPAFAVLLALWASRIPSEALERGAKLSVRSWLWLPVLAGLLAALVSWRFGAHGWAFLTAFTAIGVGAVLWKSAAHLSTALVGLAMIAPLTEISRLPLFEAVIAPTAGQIAREIEQPTPGTQLRLVFDDPKLVDEIGLIAGGLNHLWLEDHYDPSRHEAVSVVYFLDATHKKALLAQGFTIAEYPILRDLNLTWPDLKTAFAQGDRSRLAHDHGETLFVATRQQ